MWSTKTKKLLISGLAALGKFTNEHKGMQATLHLFYSAQHSPNTFYITSW